MASRSLRKPQGSAEAQHIEPAKTMELIGKTRRPVGPKPRGVLRHLSADDLSHRRVPPPPDLADWVEHFWSVRWNFEGRSPQLQETLPHPSVHIVIEPGSASVRGVHTGRWTRLLDGRSSAFGIKFRPGAFRPFLGRPVSSLTNTALEARALFGDDASVLMDVNACACEHTAAAVASDFLRQRLPAHDQQALLADRIVCFVADSPDIHSTSELAGRFNIGVRALQRLFNEFVGAGPKWVIKRYRIHEAIARVQSGQPVSWSALASDLGYFDQAHLIADFRNLTGQTPGEYLRTRP